MTSDALCLSNILKFYKDELTNVDKIILSISEDSQSEFIPVILDHIISSGGKRLRPLLTLISGKASEKHNDSTKHLAAAIELIHTATLLHDDVVDDSKIRRAIPTANSIWGNQASILVGDFLFSKAFVLMVETKNIDALSLLSRSSSIISQGEILQLENVNKFITETTYLKIISDKTASLFGAACQSGYMSSLNYDDKIAKSFFNYGFNLGIAFQIIDDCKDYFSSSDTIGKNIGDDFYESKVTLPVIYLLDKCSESEKKEINMIFAKRDKKPEDLTLLLNLLKKYDIHNMCISKAKYYSVQSQISIQNTKFANQHADNLIGIASEIIK